MFLLQKQGERGRQIAGNSYAVFTKPAGKPVGGRGNDPGYGNNNTVLETARDNPQPSPKVLGLWVQFND